tara:strand:- start:6324 stop:6743 length:420 start_codon:yes stop_codon:yes gene_type:complete
MRAYLAKIRIPEEIKVESTGFIGEKIFELWFSATYQGEQLFKQKADRDYQKIDFADEKGFTYQIKTTKAKTFTFNCSLEHITEHLTAEVYVCIQLENQYAYIEHFKNRSEILNKLKKSFVAEKSCFLYSSDLLQKELFI